MRKADEALDTPVGGARSGGRGAPPGRLVELRVLDGPNLYFTRPAIKLSMSLTALAAMPDERIARRAAEAGVQSSGPGLRPGPPGSGQRIRFLARVAAHVTRVAADASGTHLAVRARPGPEAGGIVVAVP